MDKCLNFQVFRREFLWRRVELVKQENVREVIEEKIEKHLPINSINGTVERVYTIPNGFNDYAILLAIIYGGVRRHRKTHKKFIKRRGT